MKTIVFILALSLTSPLAFAQTPVAAEYHSNGNVKTEYVQLSDSKVKASYYNAQGALIETGQFLNGKRDGEWVSYNAEGVMTAKINFMNGKKSGVWLFWDDQGNLAHELNYDKEATTLVVHVKD